MCFECRLLGALVNAGRSDEHRLRLSGSSLSRRSFSPTTLELEDKGLRDWAAEVYLQDTLSLLATTYCVELVPIKVDSDGSCLPHALSRCLVGKEILYDALRLELQEELREHEAFYKGFWEQGMDADELDSWFQGLVDEAAPTHGVPTGRWLGPEHIFAFANLLQRPILLLDTPEEMQKDDCRCGLFLPLRVAEAQGGGGGGGGEGGEATEPHLSLPPLVIGWANEHKNHFVSLVVPSRHELLAADEALLSQRAKVASPALWDAVGQIVASNTPEEQLVEIAIPDDKQPGDACLLRDPASGEEFMVKIPLDKGPGDSFVWNAAFGKLHAALARFYACNAPIVRRKSASILIQLLGNLVDALLSGPGAQDQVQKRNKVKLSNSVIRRFVVGASGAVPLLEVVGFSRWTDPEGGEEHLRFDAGFSQCTALIIARDALLRIQGDPAAVLGAGQIPVGDEAAAFGPRPAFAAEGASWPEFAHLAHPAPKTAARRKTKIAAPKAAAPKKAAASKSESESSAPATATATAAVSAKAPTNPSYPTGAWLFGNGSAAAANDRLEGLVQRLKAQYANVSKGTEFKDVPWDVAADFSVRLTLVKCPQCQTTQHWAQPLEGYLADAHLQPCEHCHHDLTVDDTGQRRLLRFVQGSVADDRLLWCATHDMLFRAPSNPCPACDL